jgi:hypothetical protein
MWVVAHSLLSGFMSEFSFVIERSMLPLLE